MDQPEELVPGTTRLVDGKFAVYKSGNSCLTFYLRLSLWE